MALGPRLDLRQTQSLVMTPQLRQAIKLLQSSNLEVTAFVEEELERNPLLERDERSEPGADALAEEGGFHVPADPAAASAASPDSLSALTPEGNSSTEPPLDIRDWSNVYDGDATGLGMGGAGGGGGGRLDFEGDERSIEDLAVERAESLHEHLGRQIRLTFSDHADRLIAAQMVALLDAAGRLSATPAALAEAMGCAVERVEAVRSVLQRLDPTGLFCCSLSECLAVQLAEQNRLDPAMQSMLDHLDLVARRDWRGLMQRCGVDAEDLAEMVAELRRLNPKPGAGFDASPTPIVVPDILMRRAPDGGWLLELNPETMPRVLINRGFQARAQVNGLSREDRAFVAERLQSANWLVKSLEQRASTILKVAAEIVQRQDGFFRHGVEYLRPLILRDVAEAVEMHESTVSRVTANKYMATPRGNFELKYFFTTAIPGIHGGESHSAEAVRHRIRHLVDAEPTDDILSDDAIVARLRAEGVDIARRTVAKYREALRIPSSVQRKREKAAMAWDRA